MSESSLKDSVINGYKDTVVEEDAVHELPILNLLLKRRGIVTRAEADRFLAPHYDEHLHDPFLMKDMDVAVDRILRAVEQNEKILIYSDFDADGVPGAVVLSDLFREIGYGNVTHYIPHRHDEGFGVHLSAVEQFKKDGVSLIITVDCGIADGDETARAQALGMDVIITDHHEPNGVHPEACAILDPKRADCAYPDQNLCGAGVAYKLMQGVLERGGFEVAPGREKWSLDMVGLATLSDMVPLTGENRVLAHYGLLVLRKSRRPGLMKMCRSLNINQTYITEDDIGFMISPRINAASRMGVSMDAFTFLSTTDPHEADRVVKNLNTVNDERKGVVASMVKEIRKRVEDESTEGVRGVIVAGSSNWRPSLLGLVANKLAEEYDRPVFLWGKDGQGEIKGSARSNGRIDLVELMRTAEEIFEAYGGHEFAGGFSVSYEKIHLLEDALCKGVASTTEKEKDDLEVVDTDLPLREVNEVTFTELNRLAPFGVGNPKPTFRFRDLTVVSVRMFGKKGDHLELTVRDRSGYTVKVVGFFVNKDSFTQELNEGATITVVGTMELSRFAGRKELRLRLVDIE